MTTQRKPSKPRLPQPPKHLGKVARQFWISCVQLYVFDDHQLELLLATCEARDRAERCRAAINKEGQTTVDRFGQRKPHPLLAVESVSRASFYSGYRALALDEEPPATTGHSKGGGF